MQLIKKVLPLVFTVYSFAVFAQTNEDEKIHEISIGTDLFDYFAGPLGGMSVWINYRIGQNQIYLASGKFAGMEAGNIDATDENGLRDEWIFMRFGYTRYLFRNAKFFKGFYLGANAELYQRTIISTNSPDREARTELIAALGPTLGYNIYIGKRIAIQLWTNPRFLFGSQDFSFDIDGSTVVHEKATFEIGNGLNIMYRFGLKN